jgi:hypothetical protein
MTPIAGEPVQEDEEHGGARRNDALEADAVDEIEPHKAPFGPDLADRSLYKYRNVVDHPANKERGLAPMTS